MKAHLRSCGVFLFLFIAWNLFAFSGIVAGGGNLPERTAEVLFESAKLLYPERVLQNFVEGKPTTRVIITLSKPGNIQQDIALVSTTSRQHLRGAVAESQDRVIRAMDPWDVQITNRFTYLFGFSAEVTLQGLEELADAPEVVSIEEDRVLHAQLAQGIPLMNAMTPRSSYSGAGLAVAICDTGIDYTHPALGGDACPPPPPSGVGGCFPNIKVIGGYDCGDNDPDPMDQQGHGTACAGIAAGGLGTVGDYIGGVAYDAKLYAVKISYGSGGSAWTSDMIEGWEWCITHQDDDPNNPIMIISTSFGGGRHFGLCDSASPAMTAAAANAVTAGMTVFVSSGNDGYCDAMGWPACISHVVSVGAVYDADLGRHPPPGYVGCIKNGSCVGTPGPPCDEKWYVDEPADTDQVTTYSNTALILSLLAPSNWATTTKRGGGYWNVANGFGGTSAACPYAAGAAACLQSASLALNGVFLTPAQIKSTLINTGDPITDGKVNITKPRVNLGAAVDSLGICTYGITPTQATIAAAGGNGSVGVTTQDGCSWTAVSNNDAWLHVTSVASGTGTGTVGFSVDANAGPARTGTITIAGRTFAVDQAAGGGGCTYAIDPTSAAFGLRGGQGSVAVATQAGCSWTAVSHESWIRITSGAGGTGNGTVTYWVSFARAGRTGTMTIAGETFTVRQQ
jgi:subtilisin family serine protease